jgi:hypothetical protein
VVSWVDQIRAADRGTFSVNSVWLRSAIDAVTNVTLVGYVGDTGAPVGMSLTLAPGSEWQRVAVNFNGLSSFELYAADPVKGSGAVVLVDDIDLSRVAAVPEPSTYALLFAGLALLGGRFLRARRN